MQLNKPKSDPLLLYKHGPLSTLLQGLHLLNKPCPLPTMAPTYMQLNKPKTDPYLLYKHSPLPTPL